MICELPHTGRPGAHTGEIEDFEAGKGLGGHKLSLLVGPDMARTMGGTAVPCKSVIR
jgi:hypothetical protein